MNVTTINAGQTRIVLPGPAFGAKAREISVETPSEAHRFAFESLQSGVSETALLE